MENTLKMTTKEAIQHIHDIHGVSSMYSLAKELSTDEVKVQPIQISNYLHGGRPGPKVAARFLDVYDIILTDVYTPGNLTAQNINRILE